MKKLKKSEYISKINPWLLTLLDFPEEAEVEELDAIDLLSPQRLDVLIKYSYLKCKDTDIKDTWSDKIYREHIENFCNGREGDISGKDNIDKFVKSFDQLYSDIKEQHFKEDESIVPIDQDGVIIDGSHRLATCVALKKKLICLKLPIKAKKYNWQYFVNKGLSKDIIEEAVLDYIRLKKNTYVICLFPVTNHKKIEAIHREVESKCGVIYEKDFNFSELGMKNFISQIYKGEPWLGDVYDGYKGALSSVKGRIGKGATKLFFVECDDFDVMCELKAKIRSYYDIGNNSVHINDSYEETLRLSEQLLNKNSLHYFNNVNISFDKAFLLELDRFKRLLTNLGLDKENFVIDGSAALAIFGLREANDLDFLNKTDETDAFNRDGFDLHNHQAVFYEKSIDELIYDGDNFFYHDGIKFLNLDIILKMKSVRAEEKDVSDVGLIDSFLKEEKVGTPIIIKKRNVSLKGRLDNFVLTYFPEFTYPVFRIGLKLTRFVIRKIKTILLIFLPKNKFIRYKKFNVYVNRDNSLLQRLKRSETYEPELTSAIYNEANFLGKKTFTFIDVGANIGFLTLNVLQHFPQSKILAFEPGAFQRSLLERTIQENNIGGQVNLQPFALADFQGETNFQVHSKEHNSGDGFFDTKRAGKVEVQKVEVTTLDLFLEKNRIKSVDFIKIDTEGAELLVLKGALNALKKLKPIIFFEINKANLEVYPYTEKNILVLFFENNYQVKSIYQELVTENNIARIMAKTEDFIAYPMAKNV